MILNRREFLKISGLTGLGTITNLTAFAQAFDGIPPEEQNFIPVIGILPNLDSIKENGIHLRWNLPPSKGIPLNTTIYRRIAGPKKNNLFIRPADSNNPTFPVRLNDVYFAGALANFRLTQTTYGKCYETTYFGPTNTLRITFPHVVNFCNVQLGLINPLVAKAFYQDGTLAQEIIIESSLTYNSLLFHSDNGREIKYIEIPTNFKYFYFLEYNGNQYLCNSQGWERIGFIDNVTDIKVEAGKDVKDIRFNKLFDRIPRNVRNYYIKTDADIDKYKNQAGAYRGLMNAFLNPTNSLFLSDNNYPSIADIPPDKLIFKSNNGNTTKINAWNLLMMGSTDPNNARLLGLYFVDKSASGEIYDYKIETNYFIKNKPVTVCGVVEGIGGAYTSLPILKPALTAIQMQQTWWEFDKDFKESHYAKVRLSWRIADQYLANNPLTKYTNPIVFDLKIDSGISRQIIPQEENNFQYFLDQMVVLKDNPIQYTLTGIDIFGQESNKLITPIKLFDKDIPPPPVKLQFNSVGNKVFLQFEYGGYQYLSDPQIKKFTAFQKNDSLYTINKKVAYNSFLNVGNNENGYKIFSINLSETIRPNFYKTLHFQERNNGIKLPAKQRKAFKILNSTERTVMFVCTHDQKFTPDDNGIVVLGADITDKNEGWNNVGFVNTIVPVSSSLENYVHFNLNSTDINHAKGNALNDNNCLHAIVLSSIQKHKRENKDLFESEIAPNSSFPEEYTELTIDRTILESNVFTEGSFVFNGNTHKIWAQNAGDAHATDTRFKTTLVVEGHVNINNNTAIKLSLPTTESTNGYIKNWAIFRLRDNVSLRNKSNGEFLLRGTKNNLINDSVVPEQRYVIAQLFSDCHVYNGQLEVLVKIVTAVSYLPTTVTALVSNKVLYFAPYSIEISNKINEITLNAKESYKNAHFAIETADLKDNKSSLSLIAQFIKTRSKNEKPNTPAAPYPCGNKLATEAFMGLPNAEKTATFCIEWETLPDLRYEVGRALDKTIISVHKDLWIKGIEINPFESSLRIIGTSLTVQSANTNTGLISVSFSNNAITNIDTYKGGRLLQSIGSITIGFEIIQISKINSIVSLILRPLIKGTIPSNTSFNIDKLPNYKAIHDDTAQLKSIVEKCEAAFSVVTGQPLRNNNQPTIQLLDEIKGTGSSRYFYKVRAVVASENRSNWSPSSVPVWWTDTSVPEIPLITYIEGQEQATFLKWKNENNDKITGYRLYRTDKKVNKELSTDYATEKLIKTFVRRNPQTNETLVNYAKIRVRYNQIELPVVEEILNVSNRITGIFKVNESGEPDLNINYFISNITSISGQNVINLPPTIKEGVKVVVVLKSNTNTEVAIYSNDSGNLQSVGGQIILPTFQNIDSQNPIKGIFKIEEYKFGQLVENQKAENYAIKSPTQFIAKNRLLKGIYSGLNQGEAVAIQITKADASTLMIKEDQTGYEYTDILKDTLTLDLFYNYRMEAIKQLNFTTPPAKIYSLKSKDALVQIKMNTPPPVPEIVSVEWWDWETNVAAGQNTHSYAIRLYDLNLPSMLIYKIYISNNEDGIFIGVEENNIRKILSNDFINQIIIKTNALETVFLKLKMTDKWGNNSNLFYKKGL